MSNPVIICLTAAAAEIAKSIKTETGGEIHVLSGRGLSGDVSFEETSAHMRSAFEAGNTIIAIMASGAVIRLLAPVLGHKREDPPVICVAEDGSVIVPLLGGHHGANDLARRLSTTLDGVAAVTTAGDLQFGVALDAPPEGWVLSRPDDAKSFMAGLLQGGKVKLTGSEADRAAWLTASQLPIDDGAEFEIECSIQNSIERQGHLHFVPKRVVIGVGCERHAPADELIELVEAQLHAEGLSAHCVAAIASIDLKADEAAISALADHLGVPARFFSAEALEREAPRLKNPSEIVFAEVGCHGVAEGAALAAVGDEGRLLREKAKSARCTCALALGENYSDLLARGRPRGHLSVVGIGPGNAGWRSPEVTDLVSRADDLVGYSLYLDLLEGLADGKARHDFDLGKEEDRVRHAMELAGEGKNVALVCSGDAGIYAMATLVYELLADGGLSDGAQRISIQVSPGISALQAAAARAGAPLGHDFCTISLSDLLTPWPTIQQRVAAAAAGDFVVAFYNPVSRRRRTQLAYARDVLLEHRPTDTPVILATNLGREGETLRVVPLGELSIDDVDMLTVVLVGSSDTRVVKTGDGKSWVYTPRGYSAKPGTGISSDDRSST